MRLRHISHDGSIEVARPREFELHSTRYCQIYVARTSQSGRLPAGSPHERIRYLGFRHDSYREVYSDDLWSWTLSDC